MVYITQVNSTFRACWLTSSGVIITTTIPGRTFAELEQVANSELINLYSWLKANQLSLIIAKTEFVVISTRQKFLAENCSEINIQLDIANQFAGWACQIIRFDYWLKLIKILSLQLKIFNEFK